MKLYKYRGAANFDRDLQSIIENRFWSSKLEDLNDPSEALYNVDNLRREANFGLKLFDFFKLTKFDSQKVENLVDTQVKLVELFKTYGVYSLSKNNLNELMWAHYSEGHKGFCVEYDFETLEDLDIKYNSKEKYLKTQVHLLKTNYSQNVYKIDSMVINQNHRIIINSLFGNKSKCWAYEDEMRIITGLPGNQGYNERCLKSIIFGFKMCPEHKDKMINNLSNRGINFYQVSRKADSYQLFLEKIKV
ncbi:DUF2971 domain-containing protein [Chryseobacterium jejuense]|uniref:DUF2971 domain-containing protein n=1 Tax=Chryseobacterium jejuense TaxID=445960 RepID=UPI001AE7CAFC|nr:DUF2971 domain-containing protein [Chryseobacterium jejuense]MBP2618791.1 hypothetical protein [Chryseobacterium jejuense]